MSSRPRPTAECPPPRPPPARRPRRSPAASQRMQPARPLPLLHPEPTSALALMFSTPPAHRGPVRRPAAPPTLSTGAQPNPGQTRLRRGPSPAANVRGGKMIVSVVFDVGETLLD